MPNHLATSSSRSPSLFAYNASQVLLDATALFSNIKLSYLFNPAVHPSGLPIERHRLFSKNYLATQGISDTRETNQIANYAYMELVPARADKEGPEHYLSQLKDRFAADEVEKMYYLHALPKDWEKMNYADFLEKRRELMAQVTRDGYQLLVAEQVVEKTLGIDLEDLINRGESRGAEFKSSLRMNLHTSQPDRRIELSVLKTLAGFLNTSGGTLIVGVSDNGVPEGIEVDGFPSEDKMSLHLTNIVTSLMEPGAQSMMSMRIHFEDYEDSRVLVVRCAQSSAPVFVTEDKVKRFYVRTGPSTRELSGTEMQDFIKKRFK